MIGLAGVTDMEDDGLQGLTVRVVLPGYSPRWQ